MTEEEWLVSEDPYKMLAFLGKRASERKVRLFMTSCFRRCWHRIHERCREAIEIAERYAEGQAEDQELLQVFIGLSNFEFVASDDGNAAEHAPRQDESGSSDQTAKPRERQVFVHSLIVRACRKAVRSSGRIPGTVGAHAANCLSMAAAENQGEGDFSHAKTPKQVAVFEAETRAHCDLVRHIFGNPFRLYAAPASWPSAVVQLATSLDEGQGCWATLHDALLRAGHPHLAEHFDKEQWHPKGCWALDLMMGKGSVETDVAAERGEYDASLI